MEDYLTIKEVAEKLRYNDQYVRQLIRKGYIQAFKLGIGPKAQYRVLESEIERLRVVGFDRTLEALKKKLEEKNNNHV